MISRTEIEASKAIAAWNEYLEANAPTTSGPGAPTARPMLNNRFCAVARAAVGYASERRVPTPAMWFTENPMIVPTKRRSDGFVTREYKRTVIAAATVKRRKTGLRPMRSASCPNVQMPSTMPKTVAEVHSADLDRVK